MTPARHPVDLKSKELLIVSTYSDEYSTCVLLLLYLTINSSHVRSPALVRQPAAILYVYCTYRRYIARLHRQPRRFKAFRLPMKKRKKRKKAEKFAHAQFVCFLLKNGRRASESASGRESNARIKCRGQRMDRPSSTSELTRVYF